jgi:hypothetical protein
MVAKLLPNDKQTDRRKEGRTLRSELSLFADLRTRLNIHQTGGKVISLSMKSFHALQRFPHTSPSSFTVMNENTFSVNKVYGAQKSFSERESHLVVLPPSGHFHNLCNRMLNNDIIGFQSRLTFVSGIVTKQGIQYNVTLSCVRVTIVVV